LGEPKITKIIDFPLKINILQFLLAKLKNLGDLAVGKFGKGFEQERPPILVVLCINEIDYEVVSDIL
jgi:hypothetical protein